MNHSKKNYNEYISNGKIFFYTKKLRIINADILDLIMNQNFEEYEKLKKPLLNLRKHLEEWIFLWDKEQNIRNPDDNDEFIFTSCKKYPKNLEELLITL